MSRLNIEERLFKDDRWGKLVIKIGDMQYALGVISYAWMVAQENWLKFNKQGIPKSIWIKKHCRQEIIEAEMAEDRGDYIYMKGSSEQFRWLEQRQLAGVRGGIASGKSKREIIEETAKRSLSGSKRCKPSFSFSNKKCILDKSNIHVLKPERAAKAGGNQVQIQKGEAFRLFCIAYKKKFARSYTKTRLDYSALKTEPIPELFSDDVLEKYFDIIDPFIEKYGYPFWGFLDRRNALAGWKKKQSFQEYMAERGEA